MQTTLLCGLPIFISVSFSINYGIFMQHLCSYFPACSARHVSIESNGSFLSGSPSSVALQASWLPPVIWDSLNLQHLYLLYSSNYWVSFLCRKKIIYHANFKINRFIHISFLKKMLFVFKNFIRQIYFLPKRRMTHHP